MGLALAFVLGVALAVLVMRALPQDATGAAGDAPQQDVPSDPSTAFPSWEGDSTSLAELVAFVQDVCDPESPNYLEP